MNYMEEPRVPWITRRRTRLRWHGLPVYSWRPSLELFHSQNNEADTQKFTHFGVITYAAIVFQLSQINRSYDRSSRLLHSERNSWGRINSEIHSANILRDSTQRPSGIEAILH